eukprot:364314-Chlamydomonas_euryale.AAC.20
MEKISVLFTHYLGKHQGGLASARPNAKQLHIKDLRHRGANFRHQPRHRSRRGPADSRSRRVLPRAGCRNLGACGTRNYQYEYGCVVWHKGFTHPFLTHVR